jgi:hypothetical protein
MTNRTTEFDWLLVFGAWPLFSSVLSVSSVAN